MNEPGRSAIELREQVLKYYWERNRSGSSRAWTLQAASAVASPPEPVSVATAYLAQNGLLEVMLSSRPTEHPYGLYEAKITQAGINHVEAILFQEVLKATRAGIPAQNVLNSASESESKNFDVFVSYAGEDREPFVRSLVKALKARSVLVWFDKDELLVGDVTSKAIERGISRSRCAAVVLSKAFVGKAYPDHEYHTLLDREIKDADKVILPILLGDISPNEVAEYSPSLGNKYHLRADHYSLDDLVSEIIRVVKPATEAAKEQAERGTITASASAYIVNPGTPSDVLRQQPHLLGFQPCLAVEFFDPTVTDGKYHLRWIVRNVGPGVARMIRMFLPGVTVDKLDGPIQTGDHASRSALYEGTHAFKKLMKTSVHMIVEFEDHGGNLYRQYGDVRQPVAASGEFNAYGVEELGKPWLVSGRIIPDRY